MRRAAVAGSFRDVENYLQAEFEAAYPQLAGTIAFMSYGADGRYRDGVESFADQVVRQYHRSELGKRLDARADIDHRLIDVDMRDKAKDVYQQHLKKERWKDNLGYRDRFSIPLPLAGRGEVYEFSIIGLADNCISCEQAPAVKEQPAGGCASIHPDRAYFERLRRLSTGFHEVAHHVAAVKGYFMPGLVADTISDSMMETQADVFGTLMQAKLIAGNQADAMQMMSDSNAFAFSAEYYFNPAVYKVADRWLRSEINGVLPDLTVSGIFELATTIAMANPMPEASFRALSGYIQGPGNVESVERSKRVAEWQRQSQRTGGLVPDSITVSDAVVPYSEVLYQYDLARQRGGAVGGNPFYDRAAQDNPLRPEALKGMPAFSFDDTNPEQVKAMNAFNLTLFGGQACVLQTRERLQPSGP